MYGKIFESIYEGSLYGKWEAIVTMKALIVLADSNGVVKMSPQAIAGKTSIPLEIIQKGLEVLSEPDPASSTPDLDGRRIVLLDDHCPWGWFLVNHEKYAGIAKSEDKRQADRNRIAEKRKSLNSNDVAKCRKVSQKVAHKEEEEDKEEEEVRGRNAPAALPAQLNLDAWNEWLQYRAERRLGKYKPVSITKNTNFLAAFTDEEQQGIVDYSIRNGYRGLFEPKEGKNGQRTDQKKLSAVERVNRATGGARF